MRDFTREIDRRSYRHDISIGRPVRKYVEITAADVGKPLFNAFNRTWMTDTFIGRILPGDVGKRVYQVGDILQVENDEQRNARSA